MDKTDNVLDTLKFLFLADIFDTKLKVFEKYDCKT